MRSPGPFAVEFFKTTLNLQPPGCKRWIISFMGRAHRPSAIRHRPASALRSIRVADISCRHARTAGGSNVTSGRAPPVFPVFADASKRARLSPAVDRHLVPRIDDARREMKHARARTHAKRKKKLPTREDERGGAEKDRPEKRAGSRAAVGAFIAYGSAKHLWNNGAGRSTSLAEEKRKYLARERTRKIEFYCSLPAGVPAARPHVRARAPTCTRTYIHAHHET